MGAHIQPSAVVDAVPGFLDEPHDDQRAKRRELDRLLLLAFSVLLVPAALAWATGWRWRPWPPGPGGYGSIVKEAREAAETYVPVAFSGL